MGRSLAWVRALRADARAADLGVPLALRVLRRYPECAPADVGRVAVLRRLRALPAEWLGESAGDDAEWLRPWVERAAAGEDLRGSASAVPVELLRRRQTAGVLRVAVRRCGRAVWRWLVEDIGGGGPVRIG